MGRPDCFSAIEFVYENFAPADFPIFEFVRVGTYLIRRWSRASPSGYNFHVPSSPNFNDVMCNISTLSNHSPHTVSITSISEYHSHPHSAPPKHTFVTTTIIHHASPTNKMSIGSVKANFDRLSVERINQFQQLKREAAEAKLYYLRDTHAPEEFDKLVDEELHRADTIIVEPNISLKDVIRTVKKKMSCLSKRKIS
jgi:hypothetical protein